MKVELKDLSETRKQLAVAFEATEIDQELKRVTGQFQRQVRIRGFRPGKAPVPIVQKHYGKEIARELTNAVVSRAYRDGVKESGLDVLHVVDVDEPAIASGAPAEIKITLEVNPSIQLPDYKGLPVTAGDTSVKDEEIDAVIENLRRERAEFSTVEREAAAGDYVKFGFEGRMGDQPIKEIVKERPIYGEMPQTWEEAGSEEGLLPGLGRHLIGMKAGDKKEVQIDFPDKFQVPELAGKTGAYAVTVQEVRERKLPELDAGFLKLQQVETVEALREEVRKSLALRKESDDRASQRRQAADALAAKVEFPIPETLVEGETQGLLRQIVEQNVRRGVPEEELEKNKEEIFATARKAAIERTKVRMLLLKVAEAEKIKVEREDINRALYAEAMRSNQRPEKLVKQLEKDRERLQAIHQNIVVDKALDFLVREASVSQP